VSSAKKQVLESYRDQLTQAKIRSQEARDGAILTLSGGALGVSFAFIDHFVKGQPHLPILLFIAWGCWATSLVLHIVNYRFSEQAFDWQIEQTDSELADETVDRNAINKSDKYVTRINLTVMLLFVFGVISLGSFVSVNYGSNSEENCEKKSACCSMAHGDITISNYWGEIE
jgi:hypothetical protein